MKLDIKSDLKGVDALKRIKSLRKDKEIIEEQIEKIYSASHSKKLPMRSPSVNHDVEEVSNAEQVNVLAEEENKRLLLQI